MNFKATFHYISYLQYPLMLIGLYFVFNPYLSGVEKLRENPDLIFQNLNNALIFMGLGISFSSLQDKKATHTKRKIKEERIFYRSFVFHSSSKHIDRFLLV